MALMQDNPPPPPPTSPELNSGIIKMLMIFHDIKNPANTEEFVNQDRYGFVCLFVCCWGFLLVFFVVFLVDGGGVEREVESCGRCKCMYYKNIENKFLNY